MEPPPSRHGPPMDYGFDDYGGGEPYDSYGPPPRGGPGHPGPGPSRYPGAREPVISFVISWSGLYHQNGVVNLLSTSNFLLLEH